MKKLKGILSICLIAALAAGIIFAVHKFNDWTFRYRAELDAFFCEGNWECISEETKESLLYSEYISVRSNPAMSGEVPGKFTNWDIKFTNRKGKEEIWTITDHALKINHDKYSWLSEKRYSNKQALTLELMDISFGLVGDEVFEEIILSELTEEEASCIEVIMTYEGGNPMPAFYDALAKEAWFSVNEVTAGDYLKSDLHDFYLYIRAHDYRLEKLSEKEQQNVLDSMEAIAEKLCDRYGEDASFEIYLDDAHKAEYQNGIKQ